MKSTQLQKTLLAIFFICAALWFGGGIIRNALAFDLFQPGTLLYKDFVQPAQINYSIRLFGITGYYTVAGYAGALISALGLFITMRPRLKQNGWLFMAFILFFLYIPAELYLVYLDIALINRTNQIDYVSLMQDAGLRSLFEQRFHPMLTATGFLSLLSYLTAILFLAWQPLKRIRQPIAGLEA
jgi:hypothetical protein